MVRSIKVGFSMLESFSIEFMLFAGSGLLLLSLFAIKISVKLGASPQGGQAFQNKNLSSKINRA